MRQVVSKLLQQRWSASPVPSAVAPQSPVLVAPNTDPDLVKLPPILVNAPVLRTPSAADTLRRDLGAVQRVDYTEYVARDTKRQREMHDLLDLANLTQSAGDPALAKKLRRETYRALTRDPTPLERAMDRSANGGRY